MILVWVVCIILLSALIGLGFWEKFYIKKVRKELETKNTPD